MSNAAITAYLKLSEATVKGHVSRVLVKLSCPNRTQAGPLAQGVPQSAAVAEAISAGALFIRPVRDRRRTHPICT